jgi:two-component system, sensor histidine kinase
MLAVGAAMARSSSSKKPAGKGRRRRRAVKSQHRRRAAAPRRRAIEASLAAYAHDIRTALTGILALGELLASSDLAERERRWAAGVKGGAEHLSSLTTLMIDAVQADAAVLTLQEETFAPRHLIEALAESLTARAQMKGLTAEVKVAGSVPEVLIGDPVRLRAALENLIDNAVKFTDRGAVALAVESTNAARGRAGLVFTVRDSGIGLTPAEIKRLFRPFAQANPDIARHYGGAGLGLAVVKALAKLMGGDLTVTSRPGQGSSFRFAAKFPIAVSPAQGLSPALSPRLAPGLAPPRRGAPPGRPLSILCVEDNPYGRVILNTIIGELGHRADFVGSGEEAVAAVAAAAKGYDLVLMDVTLPGIDGLEATRRIRAGGGAAARTPIVGISGRTAAGDDAAARAAGMDAYLRKPLSPSALSAALATVLRRSSPPG